MAEFDVTKALLEDFTSVKLLGEGSYGRVFLVKANAAPEKTFALKAVKRNLEDASHIFQLVEEIEICCNIENKFCIETYIVYKTPTHYFFLMEACLGGDLWKIIHDNTSLPIELTRFIMASLLQALQYLHGRGIVYRDLKPENILIAANGYIKLADFGFSKNIGLDGKADSICGTAVYYAPELVVEEEYGFAVDYWALGIIFYEMLFGKNPFSNSNPLCTDVNILQGFKDFHFPQNFPTECLDLLLKLCWVKPEDRLQFNKKTVVSHIEAHAFFHGFDFNALRTGMMPAPYLPAISGPYDISNFSASKNYGF